MNTATAVHPVLLHPREHPANTAKTPQTEW